MILNQLKWYIYTTNQFLLFLFFIFFSNTTKNLFSIENNNFKQNTKKLDIVSSQFHSFKIHINFNTRKENYAIILDIDLTNKSMLRIWMLLKCSSGEEKWIWKKLWMFSKQNHTSYVFFPPQYFVIFNWFLFIHVCF